MQKKSTYPNLRKAIHDKGLKLNFVAGAVGLNYKQLHLRMSGKIDFLLSEMRALSKLLDESMDYLFN
jgi:hypothetical protein